MNHQRSMYMYVVLFLLHTAAVHVLGFSIDNVHVTFPTPCSHNNNIIKVVGATKRISTTYTCCRSKRKSLLSVFSNDKNSVDAELINFNQDDDEDNGYDEDIEWIPDRDRARILRESTWKRAEANPPTFIENDFADNVNDDEDSDSAQQQQSKNKKEKRLFYTDEEEELIAILGGKDSLNPSPKREIGFLGDSTLREIAMDFQVPLCYLADVLCGWGVPPPINPNIILGDMITGEQAFAILEAIHTLDLGSLNDRYAEFDLETLCFEYDVELSDGFELAMKEGWNLPFGVKTFIRVEQEEYFIEKLVKDVW